MTFSRGNHYRSIVTFQTSAQDAGLRVDQFLTRVMPQTSRARLQQWISAKRVRVDGAPPKASLRLRAGQRIEVEPDTTRPPLARAVAEDIPLRILYEDDHLVAVDKPAGMTVHAGAGVERGTLVNALLGRFGRLSGVGGELRPGIVHRLDRLTSGVLLVAKTDAAHQELARQFASRQVNKLYVALVHGLVPGKIRPGAGRPVILDDCRWTRLEMPIRRDRRRRTRMTARSSQGRPAVTDFRVLRQWPGFSLLEVRIWTGRTHQIRAHLAAIGHPVVGDTLYGAPAEPRLGRLFLHARQIGFRHPATGEEMTIEAPVPEELERRLAELE